MRAIDLYCGVGGWALGLKLAGIDVVASYEWWEPAVNTHRENIGSECIRTDIRQLPNSQLPKSVDLVVGSPPCTQFSYSNRGGSGDIEDGLKDICKFLEVVDFLKPKFWIMENVPRVAKILDEETKIGGRLFKFRKLIKNTAIINMSEYGLPQGRKRMIAGNFPIELLATYKAGIRRATFENVILSLNSTTPSDPNFGFSINQHIPLIDHEKEAPLNPEEYRINFESKRNHPVYNKMEFPDSLNRPSRTVTATCTRVSRESIVISEPTSPEKVRRLTVRERATLQGFPITYQFFGNSYSEKLKMVGNAIPPVFTYYLGCALQGIKAKNLVQSFKLSNKICAIASRPKYTKPDQPGKKYPENRSFRFAIPSLRFGSGMRFELSNSFKNNGVEWSIKFFHGTSKNIKSLLIDDTAYLCFGDILNTFPHEGAILAEGLHNTHTRILNHLGKISPDSLQESWAHISDGFGPFDLIDCIDHAIPGLLSLITEDMNGIINNRIASLLLGDSSSKTSGAKKIQENSRSIFIGTLLAAWLNNQYALSYNGIVAFVPNEVELHLKVAI